MIDLFFTVSKFSNSYSFIYIIYVGILGLCMGSFLNVMISRMPLSLSLFSARSHCSQCKHNIPWKYNIPLFSYAILKGKCHFCQNSISLRYPLVEGITCVLSFLIILHFGISFQTAMGLIFTWSLIALACIDFESMILPNAITVPLLWMGVFASIFDIFASTDESILGAILGYLSLWLMYWFFKILYHKEGLGFGDFKLMAMIGAWLGWQALPFILLFSSATAAACGITLIILKKQDKNTPMPFGPFIAVGAYLSLLWEIRSI